MSAFGGYGGHSLKRDANRLRDDLQGKIDYLRWRVREIAA
jgi:hypothetical protein